MQLLANVGKSSKWRILAWVLLAGLTAGCSLEQSPDLEDLTSRTDRHLAATFEEPVEALVHGLLNDSAHVISRRDARRLKTSVIDAILKADYPAVALEQNRRYIEAAKVLLGTDASAWEILESYDQWGNSATENSDAFNTAPNPRTFVLLSIDELKEKLAPLDPRPEWASRQLRTRTPRVKADIDVVSFNMENSDVLGYETTSTGLSYVLVEGAGDSETQVRFIVYWDGEQLRGYVPLSGNPFNRTHRIAFGNAGSWPADQNLSPAERWEKQAAEESEEIKYQLQAAGIDIGNQQDFDSQSYRELVANWVPLMWDLDKIKQDITERFKRIDP